jgi:uncharacterized protein (DUF433 family)
MDLFARISIDPAVRFAKPCVRGTRLTVGDVLGTLAAGSTEAQLLEDFPQLTHEDVLACLAFAAERAREQALLLVTKDEYVLDRQRQQGGDGVNGDRVAAWPSLAG